MNWRIVLPLVLLAGALLSGWFAWRSHQPEVAADVAEHRSDYILRDFEVVTLDGAGQESFSLQAPELRQTPGGRTLELVTPLFLMPDAEGERWQVRSKTGWVNEKSTLIKLRGDVVADSPAGASRPTVLKTQQLDVHPNDNRATSEAAVTITTPGTTMHGTGMEADLSSKRIQLLSKVSLTNDPIRR